MDFSGNFHSFFAIAHSKDSACQTLVFFNGISGAFDDAVAHSLPLGQLRFGAKRPEVRHETCEGADVERRVSK